MLKSVFEKRLHTGVFLVNIVKFLGVPILKNIGQRPLLNIKLSLYWEFSIRGKTLSLFHRSSHRRYSIQKLLLRILLYSEETTYVEVSFSKETPAQVFSYLNILKFLRAPIFKNIGERLLVNVAIKLSLCWRFSTCGKTLFCSTGAVDKR